MLTIGAIHSGATSLAPILEREWAPYLDDYKLINIIDDSLIHTVIRDGEVTSRTVRRVVDLCEALILAGADVVVETCSSIGEAAEIANRQLDRPVLRIDQGMAEEAVTGWRLPLRRPFPAWSARRSGWDGRSRSKAWLRRARSGAGSRARRRPTTTCLSKRPSRGLRAAR